MNVPWLLVHLGFLSVAGLPSHGTGIRSQVYVLQSIPARKQRCWNHKQSNLTVREGIAAESGMLPELIRKSGRKMGPQRSSGLRSARSPSHLSEPSFHAHRNPIIIRLFLTQKITLIGGFSPLSLCRLHLLQPTGQKLGLFPKEKHQS